ncbi:MAG TPA: DUF3500 domain-containing protein, partial [Burkholderiales bacterium]|nr:DUF3500 domain-containing protein [Burkholderiales bacterium]
MNPLLPRAARVMCMLAMLYLALDAAIAQSVTSRIVSAANHFVSTLDEQQRKAVLFAYDNEQQRARWSNLPNTSVRRTGVAIGE